MAEHCRGGVRGLLCDIGPVRDGVTYARRG